MPKKNRRCDILVTGFGPFPRVPVNPTAVLARLIGESRRLARLGVAVRSHVFATRYAILARDLPERFDAAQPKAVLMLGVAARARQLRVETRAVNMANRMAPDASGKTRRSPALVKGGPAQRSTTAPASRLQVALSRGGLPIRRSIDAGRYLCNASYFTALGHLRKHPEVPVVFVHVPMPGSWATGPTPRPRKGRPPRGPIRRPALAAMARGLEAAALLLVREAANRRLS